MFDSSSTAESIEPLGLDLARIDGTDLWAIDGGGVSSAKGFRASGVHAGFKKAADSLDLALVIADEPCACAATFTQNVFCAAPVQVSRDHLGGVSYGTAKAAVINSGIANAATGDRGMLTARESAEIAAGFLGCEPSEVVLASTGVIGAHLPLDPFRTGIPAALEAASTEGGSVAARAIMTTDTRPKECAVSFSGDAIGYPGAVFTVGGMAKGAGMIMPNMATMISVITTDAPVLPHDLRSALADAVEQSFNRVTVDSDTSTNDSCFAFANGRAVSEGGPFVPGTPAFDLFERALAFVCRTNARAMAADGEGATRLVTVQVVGAASASDADRAARTVANSPLVKTAVYGNDANWGRIAAALGRSGARFDQEAVDIDIMGIPVCRKGLTVAFDEDEALRRFESPEIAIDIDLGSGSDCAMMWSCDFSHDYVTINGSYRS